MEKNLFPAVSLAMAWLPAGSWKLVDARVPEAVKNRLQSNIPD